MFTRKFLAVAVVSAALGLSASAALADNGRQPFEQAVQTTQNEPITNEPNGDNTAAVVMQGEVTQKFITNQKNYIIAIDGTPYTVPAGFYYRVRVGDSVSFDGMNWTITNDRPTIW